MKNLRFSIASALMIACLAAVPAFAVAPAAESELTAESEFAAESESAAGSLLWEDPVQLQETEAAPEAVPDFLQIENGILQPVLQYSDIRDPSYSNANSENLTFCVYVETDHDTDGDGLADLVKALVMVPRAAVEGAYKASVIYDPTPYAAGELDPQIENSITIPENLSFDYDLLYQPGEKRESAGVISTMDAALNANPGLDWNYTVPVSGECGYYTADSYVYYLIRGYAIVLSSGIGTYGSEGYELCGTDLECDSHKCVVEWLAGNRRAFADPAGTLEIAADWCSGNVAMTGTSYGGTIPFEVATTGVEGLRTIIPFAGIASWYDYSNSQGVSKIFSVDYTDLLALDNAGALFKDDDWTVFDQNYRAYLSQTSIDQAATNGDYAPVWEALDYSRKWENIQCSALIVQGLNDFNVTSKHADLMIRAFEKAGMPVHVIWHQDGHNDLEGMLINGIFWQDLMNGWLAHFLYDVDNNAEDLPAVLAQSNIDGTFTAYDSWDEYTCVETGLTADSETGIVNTTDLGTYVKQFTGGQPNAVDSSELYEQIYLGMEGELSSMSRIDLPESTTIYGVPQVHVKLSTDVTDKDGLMVTAVLIDWANDMPFEAYMLKQRLHNVLPRKTLGYADLGGNAGGTQMAEYVRDTTTAKCISFGWTDLCNPGLGYDSSEYTESFDLEAGTYYDYTFYMMPTVYTLAPGHTLYLLLTAWDPCRVFLDESFNIDPSLDSPDPKYQYSYRIDYPSSTALIPTAPEGNDNWADQDLWGALQR